MQVLRGIAISPGIAVGPVVVLDSRGLRLPPRSISESVVTVELERLDRGIALVPLLDRRSAACVLAMTGKYGRLLERIAADPLVVMRGRLSLRGWSLVEATMGMDRPLLPAPH